MFSKAPVPITFAPADGGGIVPQRAAAPIDSPVFRALLRVGAFIPRLPRPIVDRLLLLRQRSTRPPADVALGTPVIESDAGGVPTTWLAPELSAEGTLVFLHGGAYMAGPDNGHWAWLAQVQRRTGIAAAMVRYRMPPTSPFPAALDDAVAAVRSLSASSVLADGRWVLGGDSAGGGLALAVAQVLRDSGGPLPAGLVLTAPWVDLEMARTSASSAEPREFEIGRSVLRWAATNYAAGVSLSDSRLSPINGAMDGLPPVHLNVGTLDPFLDDVRRLRAALDAVGVPVEFIEQEGAPHVYPQEVKSPEAEWTIRAQVRWIRERLAPTEGTSA